MNNFVKNHFFWKYATGDKTLFSKPVSQLYSEIDVVHKITYVFFVFLVFVELVHGFGVLPKTTISPLWPIAFLEDFNPEKILLFIQIGLSCSLIGLLFNHKSYVFRITNFIFFFLLLALIYSFGKISHGYHLILLILFCFLFIPKASSTNYKEKTILVFASAQFLMLTAFTLTGVWKILHGFNQFFKGEVSIFSPLSFRNVLVRQFEISEHTILGDVLINHYVIGWLLYLVVIYVELFSVVIFFRPNLHKVWGVILIAMAAGIKLILGVNFFTMPFVVGILLILSPFNRQGNVREIIAELPVVYVIRKIINKVV